MSRKLIALVVTLLFIASVVGVALAESPGGNFRKGKYLFRKSCRSCHVEGGAASDLSPADKTQAEWTKTFADWQSLPCSDDWSISDTDRLDIFTYMHDFAKDSPSPAKCS
jgi:hypothetical protein